MSMDVLPWTQRVTQATPAYRNRVVDGLRAAAMTGVVLGHWLVTGLAADQNGALHQQSPLSSLRIFTPLSWVLQTLGLFFFVSGYAAAAGLSRAQSRGRTSPGWLVARMRRLLPPIVVFAAAWLLTYLALRLAQVAAPTRHVISSLMLSPLWFALVLALLTVITPAVCAAERRLGPAVALVPLGVVASVDLARFAVWPTIPNWLTSLNNLAGWLVPYVLGIALAHGHSHRRRAGAALILTGITAGSLLIVVAGYPASAVGVPGDGRSNLNPPSLLAVALSLVQIGLALTAWKPLTRLLQRPTCWAVVVVLNLSAMTVFLWHQSALLIVAGAGHVFLGDPVGLVSPPADSAWVYRRLLWLPVFLAVLALLWLLFRRIEQRRPVRIHLTASRRTP